MRKILWVVGFALAGCGGEIADDATGTTSEPLNGDTWTQIVTSTGTGFGAAYDVAFNGPHGVLIGGARYLNATNTTSACVVRRTTTDGTTFANDEIFDYGGQCFTSALVALPSGVSYAAEVARTSGGVNHLLFRKSVSGVGGYLTDLDITYPSPTEPAEINAAVYNGAAYIQGNSFNTSTLVSTPQLWRSTGGSLSTLTPPANVALRNICATSHGVTLVASSGRTWQVYTSTTGTAPWTLFDTYTPPGTVVATPYTCTEVNGVTYVSGVYLDTGTTWIMRTFTSAAGWNTVESETSSEAYGPEASGPGKNNRVYITGTKGASDLTAHAHTLRFDPTTGWQDSDQVSGDGSELRGYAYSPTYGTYTVGRDGNNDAIVRRIAP